MTWSIVARDASGALGVIVASRFFAIGALCPHAHSGIGALCTQALVNPLYGARGLSRLAQGMAPADVVRVLVNADAGREHRQLHLIDAEGNIAAHTGVECIDWCGQIAGEATRRGRRAPGRGSRGHGSARRATLPFAGA
jgi:uncharacterized Ntn-hydrolase superfamily protein